jgi:arginine decarboxylase
MDQSEALLLEALAAHHRLDRYGFTPPGHSSGRASGDILVGSPTS